MERVSLVICISIPVPSVKLSTVISLSVQLRSNCPDDAYVTLDKFMNV